jgi:hypothetical protein
MEERGKNVLGYANKISVRLVPIKAGQERQEESPGEKLNFFHAVREII